MKFKKVITPLGRIYLDYDSSESEFGIYDSNKKFMATLDKNETSKAIQAFWFLRNPQELYSLSFAKDISEEPSKEDQELFTIGNTNFYIIY
jgi:hypothetical protein